MSVRYLQYGLHYLAVTTMVLATVAPASGTVLTVPEIDGGSISMGLGLLAAGALMLRARMNK
jgi:hypothetical protein